jgi:hypothetical protein
VGGDLFDRHFLPVALELLGDELRKTRVSALAHLGAHDADDRRVVGLHDHPGIHFRVGARCGGLGRLDAERDVEPEREPASGNCG